MNNEIYKDEDSNISYNGIKINIIFDIENGKSHIQEDYEVINNIGIDNIIKNHFIPWLKGDTYNEKDDEQIYNGLKIYNITYQYSNISKEYSPTQEEDFFGEFTFAFECGNDYVEDIFECVEMIIYVNNGKIVKVIGYDT